MEQTRIGRSRQFVGERLRLFGGHIEPEHFYGDKAIACGFVSTEHRTQRANTNLMQDPERSECRWWSEGSRVVSGHSGEGRKNVAQIVPHPKLKRGILRRSWRVELRQAVLDLFTDFDTVRDVVRVTCLTPRWLACSGGCGRVPAAGRRRSHA